MQWGCPSYYKCCRDFHFAHIWSTINPYFTCFGQYIVDKWPFYKVDDESNGGCMRTVHTVAEYLSVLFFLFFFLGKIWHTLRKECCTTLSNLMVKMCYLLSSESPQAYVCQCFTLMSNKIWIWKNGFY